MDIFRGYKDLPAFDTQGPAIALGNFDGVHRGHQAVIEAARALAPDAPLGVASFEPHPRVFFNPAAEPIVLTPLAEKGRKLEALGIDRLYVCEFDEALSQMTPETFVSEVLVNALAISAVAVGGDFRFGAKRAGDTRLLTQLGAELGFAVEVLDGAADEEGSLYSSSSARAALRDGKPEDATAILGEPHRIRGQVEQGDQRGRQLDFPTANLPIEGILAPKFGVYAVEVHILEGPHAGVVQGVANIGLRPTFEKSVPILEAHIFDFDGDLYGTEISVLLIAFLRPEQKFSGLPELRAQIAKDATRARALLGNGPLPVAAF